MRVTSIPSRRSASTQHRCAFQAASGLAVTCRRAASGMSGWLLAACRCCALQLALALACLACPAVLICAWLACAPILISATQPPPCPQEVNVGKHNWGNYFLAAYKGVFEHLAARGGAAPPPAPAGLQIMIHGTVPTGACLSAFCALAAAVAVPPPRLLRLFRLLGWVKCRRGGSAPGSALRLRRAPGERGHNWKTMLMPAVPAVPAMPAVQVAACPAQQPSCAPAPWRSCTCTAYTSQRG